MDFGSDPERVDYGKMSENRLKLLRKAYERSNISQNPDYQAFVAENQDWLPDHALFMALKGRFNRRELYFDIEFQQYLQFVFFSQLVQCNGNCTTAALIST